MKMKFSNICLLSASILLLAIIVLVDRQARKVRDDIVLYPQRYFQDKKAILPHIAQPSLPGPLARYNIVTKASFLPCAVEANKTALTSFRDQLPTRYKDVYRQSVNISTFLANAHELHCAAPQMVKTEISRLANDLFLQIRPYLVKRGEKTYFVNRFTYQPLDYALPAEWSSALSQGKLLMALQRLYKATGDKQFSNLAQEVLKSFEPSNDKEAVSFYDNNGYLWLDEYPAAPQHSFVLNGHIWGLIGLHDYYLNTDSPAAKDLLIRGIDTIKNNLHHYRIPNNINCYDLRICETDYLPSRTLKQQKWLFEITGDSFFRDYQEIFRQDFKAFEENKKRIRGCAKNPLTALMCLF